MPGVRVWVRVRHRPAALLIDSGYARHDVLGARGVVVGCVVGRQLPTAYRAQVCLGDAADGCGTALGRREPKGCCTSAGLAIAWEESQAAGGCASLAGGAMMSEIP